MTSMASIFIRITANAVLVAALLIVWWFLAAATSESSFNIANGVLTRRFGDLVMFKGLWFHTLGSIRHLI